METEYRQKKGEILKRRLEIQTKQPVGVAFSGGVDSSLLLRMACESARKNGTRVTAFMMQTELLPIGDVEVARQAAKEAGAEFRLLAAEVLKEAGISQNPTDRCYRCKKTMFSKMKAEAEKSGIVTLLEGTNADDLHVYRPGLRAIRELGFQSPLADAGVTKEEVRAMAAEYGLCAADRPSSPCMATRFPYGTNLTKEKLDRVKKGEEYLKTLGLHNVRLRVHGSMSDPHGSTMRTGEGANHETTQTRPCENLVRIEVDGDAMERMIQKRQEVVKRLKELGYTYITLDLEGFRSGSMDVVL